MKYNVKMTKYATEQLKSTVMYISKTLLVPDTARAWTNKLKAEISKLSELPNRFMLVDEEPWHSQGVHKMFVGNFIVYFWIDESKKDVWVIAVVYGRSDQLSALKIIPE